MCESAKYKVSFRIMDDNLDPIEISKMLNIEPSISHKKGDANKKIGKKGKVIEHAPF